MAPFPSTPVTLTGGCGCGAVRYTISIPEVTQRPVLATLKDGQNVHLPQFMICHCDDCRRYTASLAPPWIVCPVDMATFSLMQLESEPNDTPEVKVSAAKSLYPSNATQSTYLMHFQSPKRPQVHRTFCRRCGTSIFYTVSPHMPGYVPTLEILMATLDRECLQMEFVRPDRHAWWQFGIEWVQKWFTNGDDTLHTDVNGHGTKLPIHADTDVTSTV